MQHFAGLDISVRDTSVCIVDDMRIDDHPAALVYRVSHTGRLIEVTGIKLD